MKGVLVLAPATRSVWGACVNSSEGSEVCATVKPMFEREPQPPTEVDDALGQCG